MFKSNKQPAITPATDYTGTLRETSFYKYGHLRTLGLSGEVTALAVDPLLSLLAVGTSGGQVHVYGSAPFQFTLPVTGHQVMAGASRRADGIKFLAFHPGHNRLVAIDDSNTIHSFSLALITDAPNPNVAPPMPVREGYETVFASVTAIEQPLPSYSHMFLTLKDGSTLAWDLRQCIISSAWRIENCWTAVEERLVRSGVPGRHKTLGGPQATCLAINPRDLNILLIGYEGGIVAWDFQKGIVAATFEMTLPPGAPGGGSYHDEAALWSERTPSVTCITWRPDGLVFAVGHADGCISFWAYADPDKPLTVRTLTHEDVHLADAESLEAAGVLDTQVKSKRMEVTHDFEGMPVLGERPPAVLPAAIANREPVFKLVWAGFPDQATLRTIAGQVDGVPVTNATGEYAERNETLLVVLGGQSPNEKPGINILQLPEYQPPPLVKGAKTPSPSETLPFAERSAYRDSLAPTGTSNYPTKTAPEDFVLMPRNNPYFGMAHDAIAIFILSTPNPKHAKSNLPIAERGFEAFVFPPPRSTVAPPALGRMTYATPGDGEKVVAMTPAPMRSSGLVSPTKAPSWRFPWSGSANSSTSTLVSPSSIHSPMGNAQRLNLQNQRRRLRQPSQMWSGGLSVFGCRIISMPTETFQRIISLAIESAGRGEKTPRVPLRGGLAVPDLQSHGAPDIHVTKLESYRVLVTWHADATVRFWDASPQILVLPTPLLFEYPNALPHLTISIGDYLRHTDVAHLPLAKLWTSDRSKVQITGVHLARETLECVITFATGEVIVTKFGEGRTEAGQEQEAREDDDTESNPRDSYFPKQPESDFVEEVTEIGHLAKWCEDGFKPVAIFTVRRGEVIACAVSDVGFIAVSYASDSLAVLDMRGPDVILREGFDEEGKTMKKRKRKGNVQNVPSEGCRASTMKWTISGMGGDASPRPRLVVSYDNGKTKIYCLTNALGEWVVDTKPPTFVNESLAKPLATFVLDPKSGDELVAAPQPLADMIDRSQPSDGKVAKEAPPHCLWIAASQKAIRCSVNYNGERVAKVEFEQETLSDVHYITRHGHRIIVALTTTGAAMVYSAPHLEFITRMDLFFGGAPRPIGKLSFDDRSGDFIEYQGPLDIALRTLFHFRKPFPPRIDPCALKTPVPAQPLPANSWALGWMWGAVLTGDRLDSIVGGPARPAPPKPPPAPRKPLITWGDPVPEKPVTAPEKIGTVKKGSVAKQRAPTRDARERNDAYSELQRKLWERNEVLDHLGEQLNSASNSASNYLTAARNAAMKEGAKSTGRSLWSKLV